MRRYVTLMVLVFATTAAHADAPDECEIIPDPEPIGSSPINLGIPSSSASASWCHFGGDEAKPGISVTPKIDNHPFAGCPLQFRTAWPYGPLFVVDQVEQTPAPKPLESAFTRLDSGVNTLPEKRVSGQAIFAGSDSGYLWICREGNWYVFGWH